jgi:hypothetical protein
MQFKLLTTIALASLAVAVPTNSPPPSGGGSSSGSGSGGAVCCNQAVQNNSGLGGILAGILDINLGNVIGSLGLDCTVSLIAFYCGICYLVSLLQAVNVLGSSNTCGSTTNVVECNSSGNAGMRLIAAMPQHSSY